MKIQRFSIVGAGDEVSPIQDWHFDVHASVEIRIRID